MTSPDSGAPQATLTYAGGAISLAVNGAVVGSVQDTRYTSGSIRIGTASLGGAPDVLHLSGLTVTQQ